VKLIKCEEHKTINPDMVEGTEIVHEPSDYYPWVLHILSVTGRDYVHSRWMNEAAADSALVELVKSTS